MLDSIIRGGQTLLHSVHMFLQVGKKLVWVIGLVFLLGVGGLFWVKTSLHQKYAALKVVEATARQHLALWPEGDVFEFEMEDGVLYSRLPVNDFLESDGVLKLKQKIWELAFWAVYFMAAVSVGLLVLLLGFLVWRGNKAKQKQYLRGARYEDLTFLN